MQRARTAGESWVCWMQTLRGEARRGVTDAGFAWGADAVRRMHALACGQQANGVKHPPYDGAPPGKSESGDSKCRCRRRREANRWGQWEVSRQLGVRVVARDRPARVNRAWRGSQRREQTDSVKRRRVRSRGNAASARLGPAGQPARTSRTAPPTRRPLMQVGVRCRRARTGGQRRGQRRHVRSGAVAAARGEDCFEGRDLSLSSIGGLRARIRAGPILCVRSGLLS